MRWKKTLLNDCKLYLILDTEVHNYDRLFDIAQKSLRSGVDIIQLRDKEGSAKDILNFSRRLLKLINHRIPYIINDRVDIAIAAKATGVHLGQDDLSIELARTIMGRKAVIGTSCQTFQHVQRAVREGADYIGFGSVFKTKTKPARNPMNLNLLKKVVTSVKKPVFAIGGIHQKNLADIQGVGIKRIAVCRAICEAKDICGTTRSFKKWLMAR